MSRPADVMVGGPGRRLRPGALLAALVVIAAVTAAGFALASRTDPDQAPVLQPPGTTATGVATSDDPLDVARAFLGAWESERWDVVQSLVSDQSLAAGETHRLAHRILDVTETRISAGTPTTTGDETHVPFEVTWVLDGLGEHAFASTLELQPTPDGWRVRWWYPTLHPDMAPDRRFQRVRLYPQRAPILGADGQPLVTSEQRVRVGLEPQRLEDDGGAVVEALADVEGVDLDAVRELLAREDLDPAQRYPVAELGRDAFAEVRDRLVPVPGLVFDSFTVRIPAAEGVLGPVVGTTGEVTAELLEEFGDPYRQGDVVGRSGLERAHERRLAGTPEQEARIMAGDTLVRTLVYVEGSDPQSLTVTIDPRAQEAAAAVLAPLDRPAALVAVDARSGEIRAAASHPPEEFDRALAGRYPPGSTFKVVGATAALTAGVAPGDAVACPPEARIGGRVFSNAGGFGPGDISFTEAFARSCNTAFALLVSDLGAGTIDGTAGLYGFDLDYEVGLPAFGGTFPEPQDAAELAAAAIGQGRVEASPLHMASVAAAARAGVWRAPHLVREGIEVVEHQLPGPAVGPLQALMREVVSSGTGTAGRVDGDPPVAGKTGSAQFGDGSRTHAWFVGFRGDLAFAVVVEGGGGGGTTAAPLAAQFLRSLDQ